MKELKSKLKLWTITWVWPKGAIKNVTEHNFSFLRQGHFINNQKKLSASCDSPLK